MRINVIEKEEIEVERDLKCLSKILIEGMLCRVFWCYINVFWGLLICIFILMRVISLEDSGVCRKCYL